jgi:hypothetical protein
MRYFFFIFLLTSISVTAQKKGTNQLYLGIARQQYFDKGGVKNDNILPNDNIRPNNPFAQNYSLEYRRTISLFRMFRRASGTTNKIRSPERLHFPKAR